MEGQRDAQSRRRHTHAVVIVAVDAAETASSSSSSSSLGSGATMEETNKWDVGGRGEMRRQHYDELEAVVAELAWRPAVAAAVAAVVAAAQWQRQRSAIRIASIFGEKRPILCVTEKKQSPSERDYQNRFPNRGWSPESVRGSFQFGDQHHEHFKGYS